MQVQIKKQDKDITVTFTAEEKQMDHSRITALQLLVNLHNLECDQPFGSSYSTKDGTGTFVDTKTIYIKDTTTAFEDRLAQWVFTGESL